MEKLTAEVAELRAELETQKALVSALLTRIYGAKSEKMSHDQLLLTFLEDEAKKPEAADGNEEPPAANKAAKPKRAKRTNKLLHSLEGLPTTERVITDPQVLANPDLFRLLSEETSVRLHASPGTFTREVIRRQTHVRKGDPDTVPFTPPLTPCLLPGSVLTPSLGALLLTEKFCYHQPFYRQEWRLRATHGIELKRNNMCNWHDHLADLLLPLYQLIVAKLRQSSYLKADETPIDCLEPGKGETATGYFWVYHHPEHGPLFDWHKSRANTCLDNILIDDDGNTSFNGYLQSDGLRAYRTFRERYPDLDIIAVSCLAHIRRKFYEARMDHPRITAWILLQIGKIYDIERKLKEQHADPLERQKIRWLRTRRHYDHLRKVILHLHKTRRIRILPQSNLGKALHYALDQWDHLEPCFLDGQIEFDNNHTEGAIRPTKLGVKNWMFIGNEDTGWRSAVIYTFVEQIRRHGIDPFTYFEWVFEKLMRNPAEEELEALLPVNW
ncbi:IS66 family transposase, partial [bacterium]|nr:IS66 family transposase [bacterium]